jgi:hypothetical protein
MFTAAVIIPGLRRNSLYFVKNPGGVVTSESNSPCFVRIFHLDELLYGRLELLDIVLY